MPIRYFHPADDDQLPITPAPPLNFEEDSDSWWAGAAKCFVAMPIATALAAAMLSASLAFGIQQQTDDVVPQPPPPTLIVRMLIGVGL